jgi:hypothetical protein
VSIGTLKICCVCGTTYSQWAPRQKTCTRRCSKERARRYGAQKRLEKIQKEGEALTKLTKGEQYNLLERLLDRPI